MPDQPRDPGMTPTNAEIAKAFIDARLSGTGFLRVDADGTVRHIPLDQVLSKAPAK